MALNNMIAEEKSSAIPRYPATAKKVIFLHMAGAPSQLELLDYKPLLKEMDGKPCPQSYLEGKKLAFAKGTPDMLGPQHTFINYGESGTIVSDRLPYFQSLIDEVTLIKSMHTDQFNHAPAQLMMHIGFARLGRPSIGSWMTYGFADKCRDVDKPMTALLKDLKTRGMLDDTLVVWGGEFGRTPLRENRGGKYGKWVGRDHSLGAFIMWMAGGGAQKGFSYGETDEVGYNVAENPVGIHDLQATMQHMMGFNHEKLTYYFQGRDYRLADVGGHVKKDLLLLS